MALKITHLDIGDRATPQATFTVGGTPTDPTQIVVKQQDAAGVETTVTTASSPSTLTTSSTPMARVSVGVFKLNPGTSINLSGYWFFRFEATGTAESAEDFQYIVDPSEFFTDAGVSSRALVGLAETKDWLQQQNIDTSNDLELVRLINDVSVLFHDEAEREFKVNGTNPQTRTFFADELAICYGIVNVGDIQSLDTTPATTIIADDWTTTYVSVANSSVILSPEVRNSWEPARRLILNKSVLKPRVGYRIQVRGNYGFPSVPGDVRQAVLDAVKETYAEPREGYTAGLSPVAPEQGGNVIFMRDRPRILALSPEAQAVATRYKDPLAG